MVGASGWIGGAAAAEALERGHAVTAVLHDPSRRSGLSGASVVSADVLDVDALAQAVTGVEAVLSAVTDRSPGAIAIIPQSARALLDALPRAGVRRLVFAGGGATLLTSEGVRFLDVPGFPEQFRDEATAQAEALEVLRQDGGSVAWSYASPPPVHLLDGAKTGTYRVQGGDHPVTDNAGESRVTVGDYASALVDELERGAFVGQRFTVGY